MGEAHLGVVQELLKDKKIFQIEKQRRVLRLGAAEAKEFFKKINDAKINGKRV